MHTCSGNRLLEPRVYLYECALCITLQVTLPDGCLQRWRHSTTAITLYPGLVEVIVFGGTIEDFDPKRPAKDVPRMAETSIITFSE